MIASVKIKNQKPLNSEVLLAVVWFEKSGHENIIGKKISFVEYMPLYIYKVKVAKNTLNFFEENANSRERNLF